jgi:solute:Na+ symporter, SSS family
MELAFIDYVIISGFVLLSLVIGLNFRKEGGKNIESFFLGGRNLPWWIAGTSMVATTFAADTPLLITELVAKNGVSGNWIWWNGLIGGMLAVFFFSKYWRKSNIVTDVELVELRYSGKPAAFLRGFKAIYLGVFMNSVIIAWVNLALAALLKVFFHIPDSQIIFYIALAMLIVVAYSSLSGLLGVAVTDFVQFIIAMTGCIVLAVLVLQSPMIGGIDGLKQKLPAETFNLFPKISFSGNIIEDAKYLTIGVATFFAFVGVQWWASWYPGAEPGGGGYVAQRMMSAKNEKHAIYATLFFQITHYALRPWPWIVVGLAAIFLYPELGVEDKRLGYAMAMRDFLPNGLKGLLLVAFFAAYMSTISTQLNWGTSYLINDFYKRFINNKASDKQYVLFSRIATIILMFVALLVTSTIDTLEQAFKFMIEAGAGLGAVLILRWYWWRINAWSEISATIAPFLGFAYTRVVGIEFPNSLFITVGFTTVVWLAITFATRPTKHKVLQEFYNRIKPMGAWKPFTPKHLLAKNRRNLFFLFICWISAVFMAYSTLFFIGSLIFNNYFEVAIYGFIAVISLLVLIIFSRKVKIFAD